MTLKGRRKSWTILSLLAFCACGSGGPTLSTPEDLATAFRRAHERRDVPGMLALVNSECATTEMLALTERTLRSHLDDTLQVVRIEPPLVTRVPWFVRDGKRYELSVPLQGELVAVYDTATGRKTAFPIGPTPEGIRIGIMCEARP